MNPGTSARNDGHGTDQGHSMSHESRPTAMVVALPGQPWARHVIDATSAGADGVKLGDLDRNGRLDIVTGWEEGGQVRVYLQPAPGQVRDPWPRVTVGEVGDPEDAIFADLDGDGWLDVISCSEGRTRTVWRHAFRGGPEEWLKADRWKTEAIQVTRSAGMWMQAAPMDLDGMHGIDLMVGSKGAPGIVGWLQAPRTLEANADWRFHPLRQAGWVMSILAHDLDRDGDPDVVISDRKGAETGVFWLENPGVVANQDSQPWPVHGIGGFGREVMFADIADLNGDEWADVAVAVKPRDVLLCLGQPGGGWREQVLTLDGVQLGDAKAVKVADLNLDGRADLVFSCENAHRLREGIVWLEGQDDGSWKQRPLGGSDGVKYDLIQTLDLDGDGDLDVITCEETEGLGVIWYENPARKP